MINMRLRGQNYLSWKYFALFSFFVVLLVFVVMDENSADNFAKKNDSVLEDLNQQLLAKDRSISSLLKKLQDLEVVYTEQEAIDKSRGILRGTNLEEARRDLILDEYFRIYTKKNVFEDGGEPIFFDPRTGYLIVGMVFDTNDMVKTSRLLESYTKGIE